MSVISRKCWSQNSLARLYASSNDCNYPRLGISISKSCGNAVSRNNIKRRIREAFRLNQHNIPSDYDYLLIISHKMTKNNKDAYGRLSSWTQEKLESALMELIEKAANKAKRDSTRKQYD